jgi:hypothetical protein
MSLPEIRPLSFGETLDRSFAFYRSHFPLLAAICLIPGLIVSPSNLLIRVPAGFAPDPVTMWRWLGSIYGHALVVMFVQFLAMAATVYAISEIYLGRQATVGEAYRKALPRFGALFNLWFSILLRAIGCVFVALMITAFLVGVMIAAAPRSRNGVIFLGVATGLLLVATALLPLLWYAFALQVLLVERIPARKALKRSRQLTKGMRGQIFLTFVLMLMLVYAVAFAAQAPFLILQAKIVPKGQLPPAWLTLISAVLGAAGAAVTTPPLMVALTLLYYNTRVLREGFDLQLMLERLGSGIAAGVAAAPVVAPAATPESTGTA